MAPAAASTRKCRICQEEKSEDDLQELNCRHVSCNMCMTVYQGSLCPVKFCEGTRSTDVIVDEMEGKTSSQIAFGAASTLFKIDMGEKLKCEAMKKGHKCVNIARMVLTHCRHRLCYDCLLFKVEFALENSRFCSGAHFQHHFQNSRLDAQSPAVLTNFPGPRSTRWQPPPTTSHGSTSLPRSNPSCSTCRAKSAPLKTRSSSNASSIPQKTT